MASSINASTTTGLVSTADLSGVLNIQTAGTTAINVTSSQLVNIGTTTSSGQLTVQAASGQGAALNLLSTDAGGNAQVVFTGNRTYQVGTGNSGSGFSNVLYFYDGTAGAERMRVDSSGNLLVGTTTSGGVGFTVATDGSGRILTSNVSVVPFDVYLFKNNGTTVGKITINTSTTSFTTSSDYRLKENIAPMMGALNKVAQLKPVTYKWKVDGSNGQGFIAHELQAVIPECVVGEKDAVNEDGSIKAQGVDTSFLVATLTAAIQELNAKVDAQAAEIAALKAGA